MHPLITQKRADIARICQRLEVFGSAARGTDFDPLRSVRNPYVLAGINSAREVVYAA